jgi:hypothetical protein
MGEPARWQRSSTIAGSLAGALSLAACLSAPAWAQPAAPDPDITTTTFATERIDLASLPAHPSPVPPSFTAGWRAAAFRLPAEGRPADRFAPASPPIGTLDPKPFAVRGFGDRLMTRLVYEARRRTTETLLTIQPDEDAPDSALETERANHAEQILARALHRSLDEQIEQVARTSWGLAPAFDWLEDFGHGKRGVSSGPAAPAASATGTPMNGGFDGSVGVRIGAHPRLVLRGAFRGFRARIDVPVLEDEIRLAVERPLGPHGRAALTAIFPRGGPGRAFLGFNFSF